jgi:hypothetical protein
MGHELPRKFANHASSTDGSGKSATRQQMLMVNDLAGNIFSYTLVTWKQQLTYFIGRRLFLTTSGTVRCKTHFSAQAIFLPSCH